jgi:LmbE family N-acetylglucosaminyl deacetylase
MRHLILPRGPLKIVVPRPTLMTLRSLLALRCWPLPSVAPLRPLAYADRFVERRAEAEAAVEAFLPGSQSSFHAFPDGRLPAPWNEVKEILHAFADPLPDADVVLAPRMDDAHQDHRLLGTMAPAVWRDALVLHDEIPKWDGDLGRSNCYVPISD